MDELLRKYLGKYDEGAIIVPSFHCDYGCYTFIGKNVFINMGCIFLDCAPIVIEENVMLGPSVGLYTAGHPVREEERLMGPGFEGLEYSLPITIKKGAWLGASVVVLPGITIGERAVVGAGSVVTRDVPADAIVAGNPARVLRFIDQSAKLTPAQLEKSAAASDPAKPPTASHKIIVAYTKELHDNLAAKPADS
jgi:maltose O-acetyltransferase